MDALLSISMPGGREARKRRCLAGRALQDAEVVPLSAPGLCRRYGALDLSAMFASLRLSKTLLPQDSCWPPTASLAGARVVLLATATPTVS